MSNIQITRYPAKDLTKDLDDLDAGEALVRRNSNGKYEVFVLSRDLSRGWHIFTYRWTPKQFASADRAIQFLVESGIPAHCIAVDNGDFVWLHKDNQRMASTDELFSLIA